jgi:ABC-2 type transport system permease protein
MITIIARKEFATIWRDGRIKWTAAIIVLMLLVAVATAIQRYRDISAERAAAQSIVTEQWQAQGEKNPHAAAHYGIYAFKPVTPLAFFDTGVSNYLGVSIWLEAHKRNRAIGQPADDMTAMMRFGELTGAFTLQVLLPLFVILLAFPTFAGEREHGTLRQLLSTGVTPLQLVIGKGLGILAAIALLVVPLFVIGVVALLISEAGAGLLPQAFLLFLTYALYAIVFLALTLAVSAQARSAQAVLVVMVGAWAIFTFAIPRAAADLSRVVFPTPSAAEFQRVIDEELQTGIDGVNPAARIQERREQTLKLYKAERVEDLPVNFQGVIFSLQEEMGNQVFEKRYGELQALMAQQLDVHEVLGLLSPRVPVQTISMELSGTSLRHHDAFARHAEGFRNEMIEVMNRDLTFNSAPGESSYRAGPELWGQIGEYAYPRPPLAASLAVLGPSAMTLLLWIAGSLLACALAVRRLKASVS